MTVRKHQVVQAWQHRAPTSLERASRSKRTSTSCRLVGSARRVSCSTCDSAACLPAQIKGSGVTMGATDVRDSAMSLLPPGWGGPLPLLGLCALAYIVARMALIPVFRLLVDRTPSVHVCTVPGEVEPMLDAPIYNKEQHSKRGSLACVDPATNQFLGYVREYTADEVARAISKAAEAQGKWRASSFKQRGKLLRILNKFILENADTICRIAVRDSGKSMVDAAFGELMVTCEKATWLASHGERYLRPESRPPGRMMFYKSCRIEYQPVGVVGTIVPWNYPFHNIFNPLLAAVFAGNAIVVKVSEHSSFSARYYQAAIDAALAAAGAPAGLVQLITGGVATGKALVRHGCDKLIFIGSTGVGREVMRDAAEGLVPVTLELGGKDPFIVCDDVNLDDVVPIALRAAFQSCGQNCVAAERFLVQAGIYDAFVERCTSVARSMRQDNPLGPAPVDCGALCLPGLAQKVHALVVDARDNGAEVVAGGQLPAREGQYYPPTVVSGVTRHMRLFREETFGPVMCITKFETDDDAVALANDSDFGLGSYCFSRSQRRATAIGSRIAAGMFVVNDYASNAMCQSLPFGGVKSSGFGRFNGIEGLRALCVPKVVVRDRVPWLVRTTLPPPLQYPVASFGFDFVLSLCKLFYASDFALRASGLWGLARCFLNGDTRQ